MDPRVSSVRANGDDGAGSSGVGGGDSDVVLRSVAQQVMTEIVRTSREQGDPSKNQGYIIEKFTKMNPSAFSGGADPTVAENWMQEMEKILTMLHCTDEQRVLYATYKLTGEVERWWTTSRLLEKQRQVPVVMTLCRFKEIFFDRYFLTTVKEAKVAKFLKLTQGNLTVQQYAAKFVELSHFAPYIIPNEVKKARMFERSLRATIAEESSPRDAGTLSQRKRPTPPNFQTGSNQVPWRGDRHSRVQR
ncbi:uncharacterized protein LOC131148289 [Malania oleifera]|uniref:uncharacterized protein LOC131148289 n=1 Tax=Malania oleifera TaxID=397392 RepID=UPI0025ADB7F2|nr:uncharacterized protein LOC131148289 [Malania oleifera]